MKVLIAVENRYSVKETTEFVRQHSWPEDTEFFLLNVIAPIMIDYPLPSYPPFLESVQNDAELLAQNLLAETRMKIKAIGKFKIHSLSGIGSPVQTIIETAKQNEVDLIVLGCHGRKGIDKFLMGSVSEDIVKYSPCSVVVLRLPPPVQKCLDDPCVSAAAAPAG